MKWGPIDWWYFHIAPSWMWMPTLRLEPFIGFFRNRPGVKKWTPGKLLPNRWGIRIWGFEFGDRGGRLEFLRKKRQGERA